MRTMLRRGSVCWLVLLALTVSAQAQKKKDDGAGAGAGAGKRASAADLAELEAKAPPAADPEIAHKFYKLANGLEVILIPDQSVPLVTVSVWYHVGSGDETLGKSGFAHLFEHMMFQGAKHIGEDVHFNILREVGASNLNGTTNPDRTNYYETLPSNQLEVALWLESDRMGYLLDKLNLKSLDNQREVVRNERRQNYDNVAYGKERFAVNAALYGEKHPYRYLTIGRHEDLEKASVDDVKAFFRKWYVPSNATLCIAGDFQMADAEALVTKWFGSFPTLPKPKRKQVDPTPITKQQVVQLDDELAKLRRMHWAWHSPRSYGDGDADFDILADALGNGGTGRLYKILVLEKQLARRVSVYQASAQMSGTFNVVVDLKDDADQKVVQQIVEDEVARVLTEAISDKELARAVVNVEAGFVWALEDLFSRAEILQSYNHYVGTTEYIGNDLDRYRTASAKHIQQMAAQYLQKKNGILVITTPKKGAK